MCARVSVLLPVFNGATTVGRAIATIRAQTFLDWELVVIDDGSADETEQAVLAAAQGDPRVRLLTPSHAGLVAALNLGVAQTSGEFIARMDADDECHPERLAEQVAFLARWPETGLVGSLVDFGGDRIANAGYALHVDWINSLVEPAEIAANRFVESPFAHPSVMFRRTLVAKFGGYRSGEFPEDYELWLRWLDAGVRMAKVPRVLLRWNDPPTRLSRTDPRYSPENFFRMKAEWIAREVRRRVELAAGKSRVLASDEYARVAIVVADPAMALPPSPPAGELTSTGVTIHRSTRAPKAIWIWGAGRPTRKRAAYLMDHGIAIAGYVDIDPNKTDRRVSGLPVISPAALPPPSGAFILGYVSSRGARDLIRDALRSRGYSEVQDFLMCA